jgi:aminoglycoside phosphotransferase family enzyme/predicted kinase
VAQFGEVTPMSGAAPPAAVAETHSAVVFFVGDRAYKLKKPVDLGFLDFRSREQREAICHREVELNRRLAPDVYLGVADVHGPDGVVCEHFVVMRRMPEERRLATMVAAGADASDQIDQVARVIAAFHARAALVDDPVSVASAPAVRRLWDANTATLRRFTGSVIDADLVDEVERLAHRYLDGRGPLFEQRIAEGRVRDGHGDLLAGDIFCLDDGPRVLDCLEFDDRLRFGDVLLDAAFLAMDLERLGRRDLADRFLAGWHEHTNETHPRSLADHYIAYRAQVRATVSAVRCGQGVDEAALAQAQLALCHRHLSRGRVRLVLVGGLPGTGKSTLALGLADANGWCTLRADEIRKELAGLAPRQRGATDFGQGLYQPEHTRRTYTVMLERAQRLLAEGESVVLDASFTDATWRDAARRLASATASDLLELRCQLDRREAVGRLRQRAATDSDVSDATPEVADAMARMADPWPEAVVVDTGPPAAAVLAVVQNIVGIDD